MISDLQIRFAELVRKPNKSKEDIEETDRVGELYQSALKDEIKVLSQELKSVGSKYVDPWDMANTKEPYPEAIDVLIKHISRPYHDKNKEGIFRALTVKEARGKANQLLIDEYNKIPKEKHNLRWVIGNAFTVIITKDDVENIIKVVEDKSNGMSRYRFVEALSKINSEKVLNTLTRLLDDAEMVPYALKSISLLKKGGGTNNQSKNK